MGDYVILSDIWRFGAITVVKIWNGGNKKRGLWKVQWNGALVLATLYSLLSHAPLRLCWISSPY